MAGQQRRNDSSNDTTGGERARGGHTATGVTQPEEAMRVIERIETRQVRVIILEFTDVVGLA